MPRLSLLNVEYYNWKFSECIKIYRNHTNCLISDLIWKTKNLYNLYIDSNFKYLLTSNFTE